MSTTTALATSEAAKMVIRRNTEEVQGGGNFALFDELFADDFLDHTPQPNCTPDKAGARALYQVLRTAFPDFHAIIHWQTGDGDRVTTYKTYHGTHKGEFLGVAPTVHTAPSTSTWTLCQIELKKANLLNWTLASFETAQFAILEHDNLEARTGIEPV